MDATKLSTKQVATLQAAHGRVNIWHGSIRSGKTLVSLFRFLAFLALWDGPGEFAIVGNTMNTVYRNVFRVLATATLFTPVRHMIRYRQGQPTATILGREVHVIGAGNAAQASRLQGLTAAAIYVDELTTIPEPVFKMALGRLSLPGSKLFATTNPNSSRHWLYKQYIANPPRGWRVMQLNLDANPTLTPGYIAALKREYAGLYYDRYIRGMWVGAEGAVYDAFDPADYRAGGNTIPWTDVPEPLEYLGVGIDYGTTNPTAAIRLALADLPGHGPALIALDEWRHAKQPNRAAATDLELSRGLRTHLATPAWPTATTPPEGGRTVVDPAAASFREQLRRDGITTTAGYNDVLVGIRRIDALLGNRRLLITDRCQHLLDGIANYRWDPKATERGEDSPIKQDDHEVDALRYGLLTTRHRWRHTIDAATKEAA